MNPLGILIAQFSGIANDPIILMLLLASGACIAFQLLINEGFAAGKAKGSFAVTRTQLAIVLLIQGVTSSVVLLMIPSHPFSINIILVLSALMVVSSALSYQCALIYYGLVMAGNISYMHAIKVGVLPGVVTLAIYLSYCLIIQFLPKLPSLLLLSVALLPSLMQWLYLRGITPETKDKIEDPLKIPNNLYLGGMLFALMLLSFWITILRDAIGMTYVSYTALIVVVLNSFSSLTNTITRANFFTSDGRTSEKILLIAGFTSLVFSLIVWSSLHLIALLLILLTLQLWIIGVIELSRRMPTLAISKI